ncbi:MAG: SPOR domain-containing protein [Bacteroidetes bacterium]|nr:SPOR domain-containing protein [Bacteroidota bacterium]
MSARVLLIIILSVNFSLTMPAQSPAAFMPADFCITIAEDSLIKMINNYRQSNGLGALQPSKSLCYVAHVHARDLFHNKPCKVPCGFHSWSDQGRWTACCYSDKDPRYACMWNKPKELTGYKGKGYELAYWEKDVTGPSEPFTMWISHDISSDMLLNWGSWKARYWKVIGVAVYKDYVLVWFGEENDNAGVPVVCGAEGSGSAGTGSTGAGSTGTGSAGSSFYLIAGSFDTMGKAKSVATQYVSQGYTSTEVLKKDNKYRVAVGHYTSLEEAKKAKKELEDKLPELWILQK